MDSMLDDDPTLPIDFDQTGNFSRFLSQTRKDSIQSDVTMSEQLPVPGTENSKEKKKPKQRSYSTNDQPPERPLSRGSTLREQENTISDLKKECFGLKMRIYFMEEKLHNAFDASTEDVLKQNIELKVTIEEIKNDLRDKSDLLAKASQAMEQLTIEKENDIVNNENIREEYQAKLEDKNEELKKLEDELEHYKAECVEREEVDGQKMNTEVYQQLQNDVNEHQREIQMLKENMAIKDADFKKLKEKKRKDEDSLKSMVKELEETISLKESSIETLKKDIEKLAGSPERSNQHYKQLYERQGEEIAEKEKTNSDLKVDLAAKTNFAEGLKDHIVAMEKTIKGLRTNLHEKEIDKQRTVGQLQEKVKYYEALVKEKDQELSENSGSLNEIKENFFRRNQEQLQFQLDATKQKDGQIMELDLQIKQHQHELQKLKVLLDEKDKEIIFFGKKNLEAEDQCANLKKTLENDLKKARDDSQLKFSEQQTKIEALEEKCCQLNDHLKQQMKYKDKVIHSLADAVQQKDRVIENLAEIAKSEQMEEENGTAKDQLIEKLQRLLREKEKYLEKYKEDHFEEIKKYDVRWNGLQKNLRDKENALHKNEALVTSYKEKLQNLEVTNQNTASMNNKLQDALEKSLSAEREAEVKAVGALHKKDEELLKLTALSATKDKQIQFLQSYLSNNLAEQKGDESDVFDSNEESLLKERLQQKEDEVKELRSLHEDSVGSSDLQHQQLLSLLKEKEQNIKDLYRMLCESQDDKNNVLRTLNEQLSSTEQEVKDLNESLLALKSTQEKEMEIFQETVNEKDRVIESLVKSGQEKDQVISDLKDNTRIMRSSSPVKSAEMTKLQQTIEMLKDEIERKKDELKKTFLENGELKEKAKQMEKDFSEKDSDELVALKKQIGDLDDIVQSLEDEKLELQSEFDLLKVSKESLQNQLEGAYSRLSRQGTPDYKESLIEELEELVRAAEKEKEKYQTLSEKLQNNLHPESCLKMLKDEITEVQHLRRNLQSILLSALKKEQKEPQNVAVSDTLMAENKKLKMELEDSEKLTKSLQEQLAFSENKMINSSQFEDIVNDAERQNKSLKADLKRCELEAKQMNSQLATMKLDYEQLVHERDREISNKTNQLDALTKDNEILTKQRDQCKVDLIACHRQLDSLKLRVDSQDCINDADKKSQAQQLKEEIEERLKEMTEKDGVIENLREENYQLNKKLREAEDDLKKLGENLQKMKDVDMIDLESKLSAASSNAQEEKKQLKRDVKELININDRLRNKLKDLTAAYEKLKTDKENEQNNFQEKLHKCKQTINQLEDDAQKRSIKACELEDQIQLLNDKANVNSELSEKYQSAQEENLRLQGKIEEFVKVTEIQKSLMAPELQKLRSEVLKLTKENSVLKIQKLEIESDKDEKEELLNNLSDLKQRNKSLQDELRVQNTKFKHAQGELTRCKELINNLEKNLEEATHIEQDQLRKMQDEVSNLKKEKSALEKQWRDARNAAGVMKEKLTNSTEEINAKNNCIANLLEKVEGLETQLDTFSPPHTSSQQNIALSSDAFTQTLIDENHKNPGLTKILDEDISLLTMHIKEMRELRKQLEETRRNNDALRKQLEDRLSQVEQDAAKLHDPHLKITLIRDNDAMRAKLAEYEASHERTMIRMDELLAEKEADKEAIQKLHEQLHELNEVSRTLKLEMEAYDRLVRQFGIQKRNEKESNSEADGNLDKHLLVALLEEIRDLREQLTKSIEVNTALREKLEKELGRPVSISPLVTPSKDATMSAKRSLFSAVLQSVSVDGRSESSDHSDRSDGKKQRVHFASPFETPTKDYDPAVELSFNSSNSSENTSHIQQQEQEATSIIPTASDDRCVLVGKSTNYNFIKAKSPKTLSLLMSLQQKVLSCTKEQVNLLPFTLREVSDAYKYTKEILRLIATFVPQEDRRSKLTEENIRLRKDLLRLKKVLASKESFIKSALEMVEENALWKENNKPDASITKKLMKARDTLKVTKGNLEEKVKRAKENASSLDSSSLLTQSFESDKSS